MRPPRIVSSLLRIAYKLQIARTQNVHLAFCSLSCHGCQNYSQIMQSKLCNAFDTNVVGPPTYLYFGRFMRRVSDFVGGGFTNHVGGKR